MAGKDLCNPVTPSQGTQSKVEFMQIKEGKTGSFPLKTWPENGGPRYFSWD